MSITVKQLNKSSLKNKEIDIMIKEQLQIIDDKILRAERGIGKNFISHHLPTTIVNISGYEKMDAQRIIYSSIICSLEQRGFISKILIDSEMTILYIEWITEFKPKTLEIMNNILKDRRVTSEEMSKMVMDKN